MRSFCQPIFTWTQSMDVIFDLSRSRLYTFFDICGLENHGGRGDFQCDIYPHTFTHKSTSTFQRSCTCKHILTLEVSYMYITLTLSNTDKIIQG